MSGSQPSWHKGAVPSATRPAQSVFPPLLMGCSHEPQPPHKPLCSPRNGRRAATKLQVGITQALGRHHLLGLGNILSVGLFAGHLNPCLDLWLGGASVNLKAAWQAGQDGSGAFLCALLRGCCFLQGLCPWLASQHASLAALIWPNRHLLADNAKCQEADPG